MHMHMHTCTRTRAHAHAHARRARVVLAHVRLDVELWLGAQEQREAKVGLVTRRLEGAEREAEGAQPGVGREHLAQSSHVVAAEQVEAEVERA